MIEITFKIPDKYITRIVDGLQEQYFRLTLSGTGSGLTKTQRAKEAIRLWIIQSVKSSEHNTAVQDIIINVPDEVVESDV